MLNKSQPAAVTFDRNKCSHNSYSSTTARPAPGALV